ncbi:MAG: site-specific integrase, partial [Smithellaceae bacterium]
MAKWIKSKFPGVRYREHESLKHGVKFDRYYSVRYKLGGRDKEEALGWASQGWTEQKAVERLAELKQNHRTGEGAQTLQEKREKANQQRQAEKEAIEQEKRDNITFADFWKIYAPQAKADKKLKTYIREEGLFRLWLNPVIGHINMKKISVFHLERLKKTMGDKGQSARSILYALGLVRHVMNYAKPRGYFKGDIPVLEKERKPKLDNARMKYLKSEEIDRLLSALKEKSLDVYGQALLAAHCGLRFGEIAALTWADIQWDQKRLTIRRAKTGSRSVFMTDEAIAMLRDRKSGKPQDLVFPKKGGEKSDKISHTFWRTIEELGFNHGIDD